MNTPSYNALVSKDRLIKTVIELCEEVNNELALGAVYDVSAKNPTAGPNNDGKWESLSALLSDANLNTLIPTAVRKGGMSIKFIQSSDNKYVQYRLMSDTFNTTPANWQGVDDEPTEGSSNSIKSGGVYSSLEQLNAQIEAEQDSIQEEIVDIAKHVTFSSIPMLCGQPMILFGNGTPQESIVPINWIQFLDGGYNWTGLPSALGQVYINTAVNSGGRYTAVWNGNILKWVNS